ncbi:MAG: lytic transglycosylase F [Rhodospirillales bacterium]|nr:MAG: lytic transglycosylase F [Rhodospirillales bacterium]
MARIRKGPWAALAASAAAAVLAAVLVMGPPVEQGNGTTAERDVDDAVVDGPALLDFIKAPWTGDLDGMLERGFVRVLTVYNPLFFSFDGVQQRGLDAEMAQALEDWLGRTYRTKGRPRPDVGMIPVPRDDLLPALIEGRGDIAAANLTITPRRQEVVDFSIPVYPDVAELVVSGPSAYPVSSLDDFTRMPLWVRPSSSYYEHLTALNHERAANGLRPLRVRAADERLEDHDLLEMVNAGLLPAIVVDSHKAAFWAQVFDSITVHEDVAVNSGGAIAWAMRKDSPQLVAAANRFLRGHRKGTLIGNVLLDRYLGKADWIDGALYGSDSDGYEDVIGIIKRYADEYEFDWRMIAAQAYQESRLDHARVSNAGAVGVMQVRPSTAADPNVGIDDIDDIDSNVHAGVKYLRFLRDRYFDEPEIAPLDQVLFSLAAYNAGPRAIARARNRAAKMGFDRDRWFGHTEVAAARTISREPVVYVRNIYKYYVAYRTATPLRDAREAARGRN